MGVKMRMSHRGVRGLVEWLGRAVVLATATSACSPQPRVEVYVDGQRAPLRDGYWCVLFVDEFDGSRDSRCNEHDEHQCQLDSDWRELPGGTTGQCVYSETAWESGATDERTTHLFISQRDCEAYRQWAHGRGCREHRSDAHAWEYPVR